MNIMDVSKLRRVLISLVVLNILRCDVSVKDDTINIVKSASIVMKGKKMRNLYMLIRELVAGVAMMVDL